MIQINQPYLKLLLLALLPYCIIFNTNAQSLPNIQKTNIRIPGNFKIDGKAPEWSDQFQAYNHATDIFYTVANDDNNFYLIVRATDPNIIKKIINSGIKLTINKSGKKDDKNSASITYPLCDENNNPNINLKNLSSTTSSSSASAIQMDSVMNENNKSLTEKVKYIGTKGIAGVDTIISVYNTNGIKAAGSFNNKMFYTCELMVPLKSLELSTNSTKFAYNIMISGSKPMRIQTPDGSSYPVFSRAQRSNPVSFASTLASTDFWGEYVLDAKK